MANKVLFRIPIEEDEMIDGGQELGDFPWTNETDIERSAFGVTYGSDGVVLTGLLPLPTGRSLHVKNWQGIGIKGNSQDSRIFDCVSEHNYTGARLETSDGEIRGCRLFNHRDACLWIAAGAGSANIQSTQNHCYSSRIACYNEGSQSYRAVNDTYADSFIGYFGDGKVAGTHQATLTNVLFQHNLVRDCVFTCSSNHLANCIVNVSKDTNEHKTIDIALTGGDIYRSTNKSLNAAYAKVGVELSERCSIRGGVVELINWIHPEHTASNNPCEGVWVLANSKLVVIDTILVEGQGIDGAVGIRLKGATEGCRINVATHGFHQANSRVLIADDGANCKGLDVNIIVTGNDGVVYDEKLDVSDYVSIGADWTGRIRVYDSYNSVPHDLVEGAPY